MDADILRAINELPTESRAAAVAELQQAGVIGAAEAKEFGFALAPSQPAPTQPDPLLDTEPGAVQIDYGRDAGGGFVERMGAAIKQTPEDRLRYLTELYPADAQGARVIQSGGDFFIRDEGTQSFRPFSPADATSVAEVVASSAAPALGATAGAVAGAPLGPAGMVVGASIGAGLGKVGEQEAAAALPGGTTQTAEERGAAALIEGVSEGAFSAAGPLASKAAGAARRTLASVIAGAPTKAAEEAVARTGIELTAGQASGAVRRDTAEGLMRRSLGAGVSFAPKIRRQVEQTKRALESLKKVAGSADSKADVGDEILKVVDAAKAKIDTRAKQIWETNTAAINQLSRAVGQEPVFDIGPVLDTVQESLQQMGRETSGPLARGYQKFLAGTADRQLTPGEYMAKLKQLSDATQDPGDLFPGLPKGEAKVEAQKILDGVKAAADTLAADPQAGQQVRSLASLIQQRGSQYASLMDEKRAITETALGKFANLSIEDGTKMAKRLDRATRAELKTVFGLLDKEAPGTSDKIRSYLLDEIMEAGTGTSVATAGTPYNLKNVGKAIDKNIDRLNVIMDTKGVEDLMAIRGQIERITNSRAYQGSPTFSLFEALAGPTAVAYNTSAAGLAAGYGAGTLSLGGILANPEARGLLRKSFDALSRGRGGKARELFVSSVRAAGADAVRQAGEEPLSDQRQEQMLKTLQAVR